MKKSVVLIAVTALTLIPLTSASPEITSTDIPQSSVEAGDGMVLGVQVEQSSETDHVTATLEQGDSREGLSILRDRNHDGYYAGTLGTLEAGNTYSVVFEACTEDGSCETVTESVEVSCSPKLFGTCLR